MLGNAQRRLRENIQKNTTARIGIKTCGSETSTNVGVDFVALFIWNYGLYLLISYALLRGL